VLGVAPNPLLDVLAAHPQSGAVGSKAADHHVDMRMFGIVVFDRNPFEIRTQVLANPSDHQILGR
jgi:hypothetical protein